MTDDWIKTRRPSSYNVEGRYSIGNEELFCDRATSYGHHGIPWCIKNPATKKVTIHYDEYSKPDYLVLCDECTEGMKKEIRKQGYKMDIERLTSPHKLDILDYALERKVWRGF